MQNRKNAILDRIQEHIAHGGKAEKITQELLKDVTSQIERVSKQVELREEKFFAQTQGLERAKHHLDDCISRIQKVYNFQSPIQLTTGDIGGTSIVELLRYIESFVFSKFDQVAPIPTGDDAVKLESLGNKSSTSVPESKEGICKPSSPAVGHLSDRPTSSAHHPTTTLRPKDLPTAHMDSGSDDYDVCEWPLTDSELRTRTVQSFLKRRKRDQKGTERLSLPGESSASKPEACEGGTFYKMASYIARICLVP